MFFAGKRKKFHVKRGATAFSDTFHVKQIAVRIWGLVSRETNALVWQGGVSRETMLWIGDLYGDHKSILCSPACQNGISACFAEDVQRAL